MLNSHLEVLLNKTSRTFALAIRFLPEPTRRYVGLAYLLLRIADTIEDGERWPNSRRVVGLRDFSHLLGLSSAPKTWAHEKWLSDPPTHHSGCLELLRETASVMRAYYALAPDVKQTIERYTSRTLSGMAAFLARDRSGAGIVLSDLRDLRRYCYVVAGIVGELLTDLFLLEYPELGSLSALLRRTAPRFGEGLQLVNILKDEARDIEAGRFFLPRGYDRKNVVRIARRDLRAAATYTEGLRRAPIDNGVFAFAALPLRLAEASLRKLGTEGSSAKLGRDEVLSITRDLEREVEDSAGKE